MTDRITRSCLARAVGLLFLTFAFALLTGCGGDIGTKKSARAEYKKDEGKKSYDKAKSDGGPKARHDPRRTDIEGGVLLPEATRPQPASVAPSENVKGVLRLHEDSPKLRGETRDLVGKDQTPVTGKEDKPKDKDKPRTPQVWKRDAAQKTFARVYVGDGNSLELVSLHVSVIVEGPRARTLVDHVFYNPHKNARPLEGTFEYPLPSGASHSYYAMFLGASRDTAPVRFKPREPMPGKKPLAPEMMPPAMLARQIDVADWGKLQEARIVAPDKAVEAYEEIVRGKVDPALLEYASGNTFRGRVYPIESKGYSRVIIAYEETLPVSDSRLVYRYTLPTCKLNELRFTLQYDPREGKEPTFQPKQAQKDSGDDRTTFSHTWSDTTPKGDVLFSLAPNDPASQATSGRHGEKGPLYLYSRLRPALPAIEKDGVFASHAVFLLDTSLSESPDRFGVSVKILKTILEGDDSIKKFNVLCFNAGAAWLNPKGWLDNSRQGREAALKRLDGILLEGATDLGAALDKLIAPDWTVGKDIPINCFVLSDGHLTWGETNPARLVASFRKRCSNLVRFFCYRTGLGEENAELYDALTRDGGGVFQCFSETEVSAVAKAHRSQCLLIEKVRFEGAAPLSEVMVAGRRSAVYPGGELIVTGQTAKAGKGKIVIEGTFAGKKFSQTFAVNIADGGELAARGWGEVAVASLLALNDPWMESLVTAYCQQFNIASRAASFLVLEDEKDYARLNLEDEKGKTIKGDLGKYLDDVWTTLAKDISYKQAFGRLLYQIDGRTGVLAKSSPVIEMLSLLREEDCALLSSIIRGAIVKTADADAGYLAGLKRDRRDVGVYLAESDRRKADDPDGAVRALSGVVEEHAGRGNALRLVGYRLLALEQPALAAGLFERVLRQRPFEPHSFRDLARSLEEAKRYPLAALMYESVLAGKWHNRFGEALKTVTKEDHVRLLRLALREGKLTKEQLTFFEKRLKDLAGSEPSADLRVSIGWNTDATDIDLHVIEPDRFKVFYSQPKSPSGGELSQDQTQGYGPERYHIRKARKGEYRIYVHYFRANDALLGGETHVIVTVTRFAGTDREEVRRIPVMLKRNGEQVLVTTVRY